MTAPPPLPDDHRAALFLLAAVFDSAADPAAPWLATGRFTGPGSGTQRAASRSSPSGVMDLVVYEPSTGEGWGEAMGRAHVELAIRGLQGAETLDHATGEITFRVPVRGLVHLGGNP